jgi:hypothetical protein
MILTFTRVSFCAGPVFYKSFYHLFFQFNPLAAIWGNITWYCSSHVRSLAILFKSQDCLIDVRINVVYMSELKWFWLGFRIGRKYFSFLLLMKGGLPTQGTCHIKGPGALDNLPCW